MTTPIDEIAAEAVALRQAKARTFLAGMSPTGLALCIDKTDLHYAWDTMGRSYLDLTSGGGALPMGAYQTVVDAAWNNPLNAFVYVAPYGQVCLQAQVDYAQALAERMPTVDGEHQQVLFTGSGAQAMTLATNLAKAHALAWSNVKPLDSTSYEPLDTGRAQHLVEMTTDRDQATVLDERISGFGRLGALTAAERYGLTPWASHLITVFGESGGGGVPFGAVVAPRRMFEGLQPTHVGANFGGNPIACAMGKRILDLQTGPFYDHVVDLSFHFEQACDALCSQFPELVLRHVGRGMARALQIAPFMDTDLLTEALLNNGVIAEVRWGQLLLTPPLIMNEAGLDQAFDQIAAGLVDALKVRPVPAATSS